MSNREREQQGAPSTTPAGPRRGGLILGAIALGLVVYGGLYGFSEYLVHEYGFRNPFFQVATGDSDTEYVVVLGASRALPLAYGDAQDELEARIQAEVMNLAMSGGGVVPNEVIMEYFLSRHRAAAVVYVLDSFAFYSPEWNEDRLSDVRLWQRAPFDPSLAAVLWYAVRQLGVDQTVFWNYVSAFSKINDPSTWFAPDVWDGEEAYQSAYRPTSFRDQSRVEYLYGSGDDPEVDPVYVDRFVELLLALTERDIPVTVVRPPLRDDFVDRIPREAEFGEMIEGVLGEHGIEYHDFTLLGLDESHFFDPDHLNRDGVSVLLDHLEPVIVSLLEAGTVPGGID